MTYVFDIDGTVCTNATQRAEWGAITTICY